MSYLTAKWLLEMLAHQETHMTGLAAPSLRMSREEKWFKSGGNYVLHSRGQAGSVL